MGLFGTDWDAVDREERYEDLRHLAAGMDESNELVNRILADGRARADEFERSVRDKAAAARAKHDSDERQ